MRKLPCAYPRYRQPLHPVLHHREVQNKTVVPAAVSCRSDFFFSVALQVEDISPVIFLQYFSVILFFSPLHFFPGNCSMWRSELCVITQQETISLPHICCQGSAKNGAVLGLSDLTTSHRAPELPTPGWGKSNTTS